jgi:ketosteroid isomerase-like protein
MMKLGWVLALGALLATGLETGGATGTDVAWAGRADVAGTAWRAQALAPEMAALVDTERSFAKMSVQKGRRDAFLAFFGEDAVFFSPEPVNARQRILTWPVVAAFNLDWEPHFGDLAGAGDLGYTTGPFVRTSPAGDGKILGTGWYFTIWKKRQDAAWKVAIDAGILSPAAGPIRPAPFTAAQRDGVRPRSQAPGSLLAADRAFCASIASAGLPQAFVTNGTEQTRVYRDGVAPIAGADAIRTYFAAGSGRMSCQPVEEVTSQSLDLGYTYGKYSLEGASQRGAGYYLRVWAPRAGQWKLAIDLLVPGA